MFAFSLVWSWSKWSNAFIRLMGKIKANEMKHLWKNKKEINEKEMLFWLKYIQFHFSTQFQVIQAKEKITSLLLSFFKNKARKKFNYKN